MILVTGGALYLAPLPDRAVVLCVDENQSEHRDQGPSGPFLILITPVIKIRTAETPC